MKLTYAKRYSFCAAFFISHMVQMKHRVCPSSYRKVCYFISHMVQMKQKDCQNTENCQGLYIPHGSDETFSRKHINGMGKATLYPTWFRWNIFKSLIIYGFLPTLYPTWFRWNLLADLTPLLKYGFISHMVQMKPTHQIAVFVFPTPFISHMVQMKPSDWQAHQVSSLRTLYPTWFRWNG